MQVNTDVLKVGDKVIVKKKNRRGENEYTSQIQEKNGSEIRLSTPMYRSVLIRLREGTIIEMIVFGDGKVYELEAQVKKTINEGNIYYTDVVAITNPKKVERRYYYRVKLTEDILVREKNGESPCEYSEAITIDLSGGGLQFACNHKFDKNCIIEVKLNLDGEEYLLDGQLVKTADPQGLSSYKYAISFLNIDEFVQEKIIKKVFKVQRENLIKQRE